MLRRGKVWDELTTGFVQGVLFGTGPDASVAAPIAKVIAEAIAGRASVTV